MSPSAPPRVFDASATAALLPYPQLVDALEQACRDYAAGRIDCPERQVVPLPQHGVMLRKLERAGGFQAIEPLVERLMWQGRAEANVRFFVAHADASTPDTSSPDALEMAVLKLAWRLAPTWRVTRTHRAACRASGGLSPMRRHHPRCPAAAGRFGGTAWLRRRTSPRRCWAVRRTGGEGAAAKAAEA